MEIYKLKDFEKVDQNTGEVAEFRVTDIKQAVKNENRVNVFVIINILFRSILHNL